MRSRLFATLFFAAAISAAAQQTDEKHYVRASAEATATGKPDRAQVLIGVLTQAPTAKAAVEQNASATDAVIGKIKNILGTNGQIQTAEYTLSPHYEMSAGTSRQNGFDARNGVEVTVDDLALLPSILDASTGNGANNISGISFSVRDDSPLRSQAIADATKKARTAAEAIAQALELHVTAVANAETGISQSPIRPLAMAAQAVNGRMAAMPTPIESGSIEVHASVTVTLEVSP